MQRYSFLDVKVCCDGCII